MKIPVWSNRWPLPARGVPPNGPWFTGQLTKAWTVKHGSQQPQRNAVNRMLVEDPVILIGCIQCRYIFFLSSPNYLIQASARIPCNLCIYIYIHTISPKLLGYLYASATSSLMLKLPPSRMMGSHRMINPRVLRKSQVAWHRFFHHSMWFKSHGKITPTSPRNLVI